MKVDIIRATHEAVDLADFGSQVLPLLNQLFDTSTSLLYWCNENRQIVPLVGEMVESVPFYSQNYFAIDLLQENLLRFNPWILHGASMPKWEEYLASAAYHECATRNDIDNFLHLRISDGEMYEPGMVGIMVARTFQQPDFNERERLLMANFMPAFETFAHRHRRLEGRLKSQPFLETLFEYSRQPIVAFDSRGGLFWASQRADELLLITQNGMKRVPESLKKAVAELAKLLGKNPKSTLSTTAAEVPRQDKPTLHIDLRLARNRSGACFIVAEVEDPEASPHLSEIAASHQLTKTETQVLKLIALGLTDRQIGQRLFVSASTIHSHVNHILAKLGVSSRIQAALIAHGRKNPQNG
ncbi:MAG TPA: LuxR C-terminal-related transcriptional regulator [bacterium]|nr:LuxR C-terminal-related transcriptional regulator [bacterium]